MMYYVFFALGLIICIGILPYIVIVKKFTKAERDSYWWLIKNKRRLPFSTNDRCGMGGGLVFCPHPFSNWSLNPAYVNKFSESQHTIEGFRKTEETNSIIEMIKRNPSSYKIVCIGGSATYCTELDSYQDSWPAKLKEKIESNKGRKDVLIFNFGVGGWGTIQSFIRSLVWFPIVRPNLVIFYQAKNDLTPLYNGTEEEKIIYPDYQNIMGQFSQNLSFSLPRWMLYIPFFYLLEARKMRSRDLAFLYMPKPLAAPKGLDRLTDDIIGGILFRAEALINMCRMIDCKVVYIPEVVNSGAYAIALDRIYKHIPDIINRYENASLFDIKDLIPDNKEYFLDKMHYTERGCDIFAELLGRKINKMIVK